MIGGAHILVVDDEPDIRDLVREILEDEGFVVSVAENASMAREARRARRPDLVLLDIWMPDSDGITLLREWAANVPAPTPVIMMSGHGTMETAVEATRLGAYDFIEKPLSMAKLLVAIRNALETAQLKQENIGLKQAADGVNEPVGRSPIMQTLRDQIKRIAQHDTSVLIIGESGSGRAVCARYLHELSSRRAGPFIRVPIAGLTHDGLSAELFGVESGEQLRFGSLEQAGGGTLFLEDVADMDSGVQARLFSALEHQSFTRVDGLEPVRINVRVIAATSRDPAAAVDYGRLHEDLYYHLNVVSLAIPPLRGHREDIPELLSFYIDLFTTKEILPYRRFTVGAQNRMRNYDWPGNVRELKNMVNRLLILGSGADIDQEEIDLALGSSPRLRSEGDPVGVDLPLKEARELFERRYLEHHIRQVGGAISKVAIKAGLERTHLYRKLRALGIDPKKIESS